jgi:hypothetical protein
MLTSYYGAKGQSPSKKGKIDDRKKIVSFIVNGCVKFSLRKGDVEILNLPSS